MLLNDDEERQSCRTYEINGSAGVLTESGGGQTQYQQQQIPLKQINMKHDCIISDTSLRNTMPKWEVKIREWQRRYHAADARCYYWLNPFVVAVISALFFVLLSVMASYFLFHQFNYSFPINAVISASWLKIREVFLRAELRATTDLEKKQIRNRGYRTLGLSILFMLVAFYINLSLYNLWYISLFYTLLIFLEDVGIVLSVIYIGCPIINGRRTYAKLTCRRTCITLLISVLVSVAIVAVLIAVTVLYIRGYSNASAGFIIGQWTSYDSLFKLIVIPFVLSIHFSIKTIKKFETYKLRALLLLLNCTFIILMQYYLPSLLQQTGLFTGRSAYDAAEYLSFPFIIFSGFLMQNFGSSLSILVLAITAASNTIYGEDGSSQRSPSQRRLSDFQIQNLIRLQIFLFVMIVTSMTFDIIQFEKARALKRAIDAKLAQEKANIQKSIFMSFLCHELRNPLHSITNMVQFLEEDCASPSKGRPSFNQQIMHGDHVKEKREITDAISIAAKYMSDLINDVLDTGKFEAGKVRLEKLPANVKQILTSILVPIKEQVRAKNISLSVCISDAIPDYLETDSTRFQQIISNLLSNAYKFTAPGGKITCQMYCLTPSKQYDQKLPADAYTDLHIKVIDTGIGMSQETLDNLFVPYVQASVSTSREYGGSGLGMSIIKQIIDLMNGSISISSEEGVGSCFSVVIPLKIANPPPSLDTLRNKMSASNMQDVCLSPIPSAQEIELKPLQKLKTEIPTSPLPQVQSSDLAVTNSNKVADGSDTAPALQPRSSSTLTPAQSADVLSQDQVQPYQKYKVKLVVVDDSLINRKIMVRMLNSLGFKNIDQYENGLEVCNALEKDSDVALVFMDLLMPVMDGSEAVLRIRNELHLDKQKVPVVAVTGNFIATQQTNGNGDGVADDGSQVDQGLKEFNLIVGKPFVKADCVKVMEKFNLL
ncbi:hypothetical protein MIR68_004142 [Amoeboaphelidium protococcarum]|nr:hypothetical protein MIR68_004142 [Amoeboaphelidium protococcarum]